MIRIGVLGCGYFGAEFARAVKEMKGIQLAAVYSPGKSSERLSSELGCPRASSVNEIMENADIDAVIIATPNYLHHQHVLAAAEAGKHIFCEKPFALDAGEAAEMVEACRKAKVTLMVGHIMHFYYGIARVQAMIQEGFFGDILTMHIERTGWEQKKSEVSWKKMQEKSGGHLFHHIHEIDIMQWIMGVPTEMYGAGGNLGHRSAEFGDEDDVLLLTASFGGNAFATLQYGSGFRVGNHFIRINGTKAGAVIDFKHAEVRVVSDAGETVFPLFEDEKSAAAICELFARTDGGISYGSPEERPPEYILVSLRKELELFLHVLNGGDIPEDKKDLFDGSSAVHSVQIAQMGCNAVQRHGSRPV